jgi:phage shock protein C
MPSANTNLVFRNDTILGVCEAIGQDFGFHPNWLRISLASLVYFAPAAVIGGYLALGVVVAVSRWVAPDGAVPRDKPIEKVDAEPLAIAA